MKKLILTLASISTLALTSCEDEKVYSANQIPTAISEYLGHHFASQSVIRFSKDEDSYEADLSGNTSIDFSLNFEATSIESKTKLPDTVIPASILEYVTANYPNNYIVEWEKKRTGQKIELNNGKEISFSLEGVPASATIPQEITTYITMYFPELNMLKLEKDKDSYEVDLSGNTSIEFNLNFEVTSIESKTKLPDTVIPATILDYVKVNFPNNYIVEWEKERNGQKIELNNGREISFPN